MSKIILPIEELKDLYVEQCWSRKEIAEYFNTTVSIVSKRLTENNITRTSQQEQKSRERTMLKKYGVVNPAKMSDFVSKSKDTFIKNYGVDNPSKSPGIQEKKKTTLLQNYGVTNPQHSKTIRDRSKQTLMKHYGVEYPYQSDEIKEKFKNSIYERYGVQNFSMAWRNEETRQILASKDKLREFLTSIPFEDRTIKKITELLDITDSCLRHYLQTFDCLDLINFYSKSSAELEIFNLLQSWGIKCYKSASIFAPRTELDFYIPSFNIGIEYNGNFFHSNKSSKYHQEKSLLARKNDIFIYHIFEYEWSNPRKKKIIISQLKNLFGLNEFKIGARKCELKEISNTECNKFLEDNHIQGKRNATTCIGLFYDNELVSVMSFGVSMFQKDTIELIRFCNRCNYSVIGAASKMFKYFIQKYNPQEVISYCDIAKGRGNTYFNLGFNQIDITSPNYVWVKGFDVKSRYQCQMVNERDTMIDRGYLQIFDCGNYKFIYKNSRN